MRCKGAVRPSSCRSAVFSTGQTPRIGRPNSFSLRGTPCRIELSPDRRPLARSGKPSSASNAVGAASSRRTKPRSRPLQPCPASRRAASSNQSSPLFQAPNGRQVYARRGRIEYPLTGRFTCAKAIGRQQNCPLKFLRVVDTPMWTTRPSTPGHLAPLASSRSIFKASQRARPTPTVQLFRPTPRHRDRKYFLETRP